MPKVSVIIPTHNRPSMLPAAVESARRAGSDVEVIVVDDASRDETAKVCQSLRGIRYIRLDRNQHTAGARNIGILASSADYVAFLDDDDTRLPGSLDRQLATLVARPEAGMVYGQILSADQAGQADRAGLPAACPEGDLFWELLRQDFLILLQTVVIRKESFFRVGLLNCEIPGVDDWDIVVRIAELYPVASRPEPVCIYREPTPSSNQGSSSPYRLSAKAVQHQRRLLLLPRAAGASEEQRREVRRLLKRQLSRWLIWNAATHLPSGARKYARLSLLAALRISPSRTAAPGSWASSCGVALPTLRSW